MHLWSRLGVRRLELKPAELISGKQRWQEPDYGVSLQPGPTRWCPPLPNRAKVNAVVLFVPLLPVQLHINTHLSTGSGELLDPFTWMTKHPLSHTTTRRRHAWDLPLSSWSIAQLLMDIVWSLEYEALTSLERLTAFLTTFGYNECPVHMKTDI